MTPELWVCNLGIVEYRWATVLQERVQAARQRELIPDVLLLLEHNPVYTRGRRSAPGELPLGAAWYAARGIEIVDTNRGGKITYHGPGQLVGYPIVQVADVVAYVRTLEQALVGALAAQRLAARARAQDGPAYTGVWVQERKIASIGVHLSRGVTTHGFAVNVCNDLQPFGWVVACGLPDVQMTSIVEELKDCEDAVEGQAATGLMDHFRIAVAEHVARAFGERQRAVNLPELEDYLRAPATNPSSSASIRSDSFVS
jgi:lipoyl(octanoyl) transferase